MRIFAVIAVAVLSISDVPSASAFDVPSMLYDRFPLNIEPVRPKKTFIAVSPATCIAEFRDGRISAGWVEPPVMKDQETGTQFTFPKLSLRENDTIIVESLKCPPFRHRKGQRIVSKATFAYSFTQVMPSAMQDQIRYQLTGRKTD
jgi:hypothetical protein